MDNEIHNIESDGEEHLSLKAFRALSAEEQRAYMEEHSELKAQFERMSDAIAGSGAFDAVVSLNKDKFADVTRGVGAGLNLAPAAMGGLAERVASIMGEYMKPAASVFDSLSHVFASIEKRYEALAKAFKEDAAKQRFAEWFETSELTLSERGGHAYSKLAEMLEVSEPTAKGYAKGETAPKARPLACLADYIGYEAVYDLAYGEGAYQASQDKKQLESLRSDVRAIVDELPPEQLETVKVMLESLLKTRN